MRASSRDLGLPHVSPEAGCACAACDAFRLDRLARLSPHQRAALDALHPRIPRHLDDLALQGVRRRSLASLMVERRTAPALARTLELRRPLLDAPYYAFALLTEHGRDTVQAVARREARR